jgi:hypothetical protein
MRSCRVLAVVMVAACVGIVCASAMAQPPGPGRGPGGPGGPGGMMGGFDNPLTLLLLEPIRKEVEVSDEQLTKLRALSEKVQADLRERFAGLRDLEPEQRRERMEELRKGIEEQTQKVQKEVEEVILPHQLKRLKEIRVQILGLRALEDAEIVKELGITEAQKEKFAAVREQVREQMQGAMEGFRDLRDLSQEEREARMAEMRERMTKTRQEVEAKTLGVLTDAQKKAFEQMKGKPFEIDWSQMMRRPGGPGRPGAPQQPQQ